MARNQIYSKDMILEKASDFVKRYGISKLSVRELAKYIGCSTQPILRFYESMDFLKKDISRNLRNDYNSFILKYVDPKDYLFTISLAYALYSKYEPMVFHSLFITDLAGSRTVDEVLNTERNRLTIEAMMKQYEISKEDAECVYRDIRFYTHGMASQICCGSILLKEEEIRDLIHQMILGQIEQLRRKKNES